jgi:hypothetical protein
MTMFIGNVSIVGSGYVHDIRCSGFFAAATGLRCELPIDDQQQVWQISADVQNYAFTARSREKTITNQRR